MYLIIYIPFLHFHKLTNLILNLIIMYIFYILCLYEKKSMKYQNTKFTVNDNVQKQSN